MRKILFIALVLSASPALADSIDEAAAKSRGVSIEVIQLENAKARITELEKENESLKLKIASLQKAATQPTSQPATGTAAEHAALALATSVTLSGEIHVGSKGVVPRLRVVQIINGNEAVVELLTVSDLNHEVATEAYLTGFDTSTWTDDKVVSFSQAVTITKTKQYVTVLGATRTVLLAEKIKL